MHARSIFAIGLPALLLLPAPADAQRVDGQRSSTERAGALRQAPRFLSGAGGYRPPLGTFRTSRRGEFSTRADQIRMLRPGNRLNPLTSIRIIPPSPIKRFLDSRNLLFARSPLGRLSTARIGRNDYAYAAGSGGSAGPIASAAFAATSQPAGIDRRSRDLGAYQDSLAARLGRLADGYYAAGLRHFKAGDYNRAREQFELALTIETDRPRAALGNMFSNFHNADLLRASMALVQAINRAKSLEELRFEKDAYFSAADFQRSVDALTVWVKRAPTRWEPRLMLAYFSWLNNDLATAHDSLKPDEKITKDSLTSPAVDRFRDLLAAPAPAPGARG